ncbi:MAG: hypothetical protein MRECE_39c002 [Mycoplasmataceae bacterium CE_OT135]|nr:MAG: hypothetical protein MRECE_39c002 [Mycoplasmataceae bacterium CE_OT135]
MNESKTARPAQKLNETKIQGILTSRIETQEKDKETYHYGFFQIPEQEQEIPVIFKVKPEIPKGSELELIGNWAKSNGNRPSFTCYDYELAKKAKEVFCA